MPNKFLSTRMNEFVSPDLAICLLRIGAAALVMTHGIPKLLRLINGDFGFMDPIGIGAMPSFFLVTFAEAICAAFVLLGLWTRLALIPLIINMTVIFFIVHADDSFGDKELPLFFLISWVTLFFTGAGKFSLDHSLFNKAR